MAKSAVLQGAEAAPKKPMKLDLIRMKVHHGYPDLPGITDLDESVPKLSLFCSAYQFKE